MAHIAMVTLDHPPDDDRIFHKEAQALKAAGHEVSILCLADPGGRIPSMSDSEPLNKDASLVTEKNGIAIQGVRGPLNKTERLLKKGFQGAFVRRFIKAGQSIGADVYHAHEPASLYLTFCIVHWDPAKVVFDSHESWLKGSYRDFLIKKLCLPRLYYLITANPITRGHLLAQNPSMVTKVIYNYPEKRVFHHAFNADKFHQPVIAHEGILPFNRGLKLMIETLIELKASYPGINLRLIGEVKGDALKYLNHQITKHNLKDNITITGWVPYEKVPDYLHDTAIGLILKTPTPINNLLGGPAIKLFNYMASGMAVVDVGLPESTRFLDQVEAGITLKTRKAKILSKAIAYLIERPELMQQYAKRGLEATQKLNWENESEALGQFYQSHILNPVQNFLIR